MIFSVIGQMLIDGRSPYTGQPVLETRRIVKPNQCLLEGTVSGVYNTTVYGYYALDGMGQRGYFNGHKDHPVYIVGKTYTIQPNRGKKAIGRTPPIASIRRQDVRAMTDADALAIGFKTVLDYWLVWIGMHDCGVGLYFDPKIVDWRYWNCKIRAWETCCFEQIPSVLADRPAERYDAWVIRFEGVQP